MIGSFASVFTGMRNGKMPEIEDLPFVKRRRNGAGFHYWNVKPTGNYGEDCAIGNQLARLILPHLKYHGGIRANRAGIHRRT